MNEIIDKLKERLNKNKIISKNNFKHELREITQELVMAGLSKTNFFNKVSFLGGTSLRLIYGINRYSENLDFVMEKYDGSLKWKPYLEEIKKIVGQYGCLLETVDESKDESNIKKAFVKDSSIEQMMNMSWTQRSETPEKINIKMEIDINPADNSRNELKAYNFPIKYNIRIRDLSSLFAGKCHALLCREHEKGRDWFDLKWFVSKGI